MKKLIITALVTGLSQVGYANPTFSILQNRLLNQAVSNAAPAAPRGNQCTNFSGKWKGACTVDGTSVKLETEIKQTGCSVIQHGNDITAIGGLKNASQSDIEVSGTRVGYSVSTSTDWNTDQTQLVTHFSGLVKVGANEATTVLGTSVSRLDGDRLVDELDMPNLKISCAFDRE